MLPLPEITPQFLCSLACRLVTVLITLSQLNTEIVFMYMCIYICMCVYHFRHSKFEGLQAAQQLALNLIETMQQEFAQFQQQQQHQQQQQQQQQQQHQNQQINNLALQQG